MENVNPCHIPFLSQDGKEINVHPNDCVQEDKVWNRLFQEAVKAITHFKLHKRVADIQSEKSYTDLVWMCERIAKKIQGRVLITLPDGHVVVDTAKGDGNTYENYLEDVISENHNTRVAVFQAQCDKNGVGYERKYSSTMKHKETYVAVRLGQFRNNAGTVRLSVVEKQ